MNSNKLTNSWLAGFWEGEGCVSKSTSSGGYTVLIAQALREDRTVKGLMESLKKKFKGEIYLRKSNKLNHKAQLQWVINKRKDVIYFLKCIYPYCSIRKQDVKNAIEYFNSHPVKVRPWSYNLPRIKRYKNKGYSYLKISKILKLSLRSIYRIMSHNLDIT